MSRMPRQAWGYLVLGLIGGLVLGGLWPQTPLHAVSTDRLETFAIATGPVDDEVEAVYFLDFLTGELKAAVLGKQSGKFTAFFAYPSVMNDLGIDPSKNPKFLMVTGLADLKRGTTRLQPSRSVVYVAEVTTGKLAAYAIPWSPSATSNNQQIRQTLVPLDVVQFRTVPGTVGGQVLHR
ncbi:MAG: hypothetical protein ACOY3P_05690 [Planctomycetota bacterium]